ncbi:MAG: Uma2 family endonuclease [Acidimicrobiales bacterium]
MRSVSCDDETFARLIGEGELYDYELGERYVVAPAAGGSHAFLQAEIIGVLRGALNGGRVAGPTNLGVLGEPGRRWYVVPDVVVFPRDTQVQNAAFLYALVAVEIRSPRENIEAKLADYRAVAERTGLVVGEVWYIDGATLTVHPGAGSEGETGWPEALAAVQHAVARWQEQAQR